MLSEFAIEILRFSACLLGSAVTHTMWLLPGAQNAHYQIRNNQDGSQFSGITVA
jgi:hypothetical protein